MMWVCWFALFANFALTFAKPEPVDFDFDFDGLSKTDYVVKSLPGYTGDFSELPPMYAGMIPVDPANGKEIFFWFFEAQEPNGTHTPVTAFQNGGPGAASDLAALTENYGPVKVLSNTSIGPTKATWTKYSHYLVIDQPVGVGFSSVTTKDYPTTIKQAGRDFYKALVFFYTIFPEYLENEFLLMGESFFGMYGPVFSEIILTQNMLVARNESSNPVIPLSALAIGNGWVHPLIQNQAYVDYPFALGLIGPYQRDQAQKIMNELRNAILAQEWLKAQDLSNQLEGYVVAAAHIDEDNMAYPSDPMNGVINELIAYMNQTVVKEALNVPTHLNYHFESTNVYRALAMTEQQSVLYLLPYLFERLRVMIFTTNYDFNCNVLGVTNYLEHLDWEYLDGYYASNRTHWYVPPTERRQKKSFAGYSKTFKSFTSVVLRGAGHEAGFFKPFAARELFRRFAFNLPFNF